MSSRLMSKDSRSVTKESRRAPSNASARAPSAERITAARRQFYPKVQEAGGGNVLRGWRRELDLDGLLEVSSQELARGAKRLGFQGNVADLTGGNAALTLEEFAPIEAGILSRFRVWVKETFGGPTEMYEACDPTDQGSFTCDQFVRECSKHGYSSLQGSIRKDLVDIYSCIDSDDTGEVKREDVVFLETDEELRVAEIAKKTKVSQKDMQKRLLAEVWTEGGFLPATHRSARRPWMAEGFERLPSLVCQRRETRCRDINIKSREARVHFLRHLRRHHGNEVRAWRRELDPKGAFWVSFAPFAQYCRRVEVDVDTRALWRALDGDGDNRLALEEVAPNAAVTLAQFQFWANAKLGSCATIWDHPESQEARREAAEAAVAEATVLRSSRSSNFQEKETEDDFSLSKTKLMKKWPTRKKMLYSSLTKSLQALEWPGVSDPELRHTVLSALDFYGCGFISRADLEWLDTWTPPEWIVAEPDQNAWEEIRELMLRMYKHPLRAWRCLLDTDNSNSVSWGEFKHACDRIKWSGNAGGAWRHLDEDLSGAITMKEYDEKSSDLLESFKQWADEHFGSVRAAFRALDETKAGTVSFSALKKACRRLRWRGDVRLLFDCLDTDRGDKEHHSLGKRSLVLKDVVFLDSWPVVWPDDVPITEDELQVGRPQSSPQRAPSRPAPEFAASSSLVLSSFQKLPSSAVGQPRGWQCPTPPEAVTAASTGGSEMPECDAADMRPSRGRKYPTSATSLGSSALARGIQCAEGWRREKLKIYQSKGHLRKAASTACIPQRQELQWLQKALDLK